MVTSQDATHCLPLRWRDMELMTICWVFEQANGDKALAGKMLGISRATLYRKLKRYNIALKAGSTGGGVDPQAGAPVAAETSKATILREFRTRFAVRRKRFTVRRLSQQKAPRKS